MNFKESIYNEIDVIEEFKTYLEDIFLKRIKFINLEILNKKNIEKDEILINIKNFYILLNNSK